MEEERNEIPEKSPIGLPFKEQMRREKAKLKTMPFKEKVAYIWEYYRAYIIGFVIFIALIGVVLNAWIINPNPETILQISWNSGYISPEQSDDLRSLLGEKLIDENANEEVSITEFLVNVADPSFMAAGIQRQAAMLAGRMLDVFILDEPLLEDYTYTEILLPLEDILGEIQKLNKDIYDRILENVFLTVYEPQSGGTGERIMGIFIGSSPLFKRAGVFEQELYLSVAVSTQRTENIIKALIAIFE